MSDTSREAYDSLDMQAIETKILNHIRRCGADGCTCDEAEVALNMRHQTCSSRITVLRKRDRIFITGRRRKTRSGRNARVYIATRPDCKHLNLPYDDPRTTYTRVGDDVRCSVCGKFYGKVRE